MKRIAWNLRPLFAAVLLLAVFPASAAITISGTIQRTYPSDQCGAISGCTCSTPTQTAAVRYATIEIRNTSNVSVATTSTTATGTFSVSAGSLSPGNGFRLIVWAQTAAAYVRDSGTGSAVGIQYNYSTSTSSTSVGTLTIDSSVDATVPHVRGGLHVMDNAVKAYQYAANRGLTMGQADVYINAGGTYYDSTTNNLYVQTSEIWHDGLVHEYGHYIDDVMTPYRGPGGLSNHTVCQKFDNNPEGAFGEGWSNYIVSAVTGHTFFWGRWCSVESGPCSEKAQNIEGNVAAVLWDLHDSANESFDTIANDYQRVWNVMDGFQFTNPSLSSFMTDYADSRANTIECQYTGQKCVTDTTKPTISAFSVSPTAITVGASITASYTVSDAGGLSRVELWRAPDSGGAPGTWGQITFRTTTGTGPVSNTFNDTPPQGTYWYGLHVLDQAGNMAVEPNPPGPTRVVVSPQQQPCTFSISPASRTVSSSSGTGSVQVTGSPSNCTGSWSASSNAGFLSLTGTASGSGSGTTQVPYSYSQNSGSVRQGSISFSGSFPSGSTFTLTQEAPVTPSCSYAISPQSASGPASGGSGSIQVTGSPANCAGSWSASSGAGFLTLTGTSSGNGSGTWQVPYSYSQNSGSTRQGSISFNGSFPGGSTFTFTQDAAGVTSCSYAISPQSASGAGAGGTGSIQVTGSPANCAGSWSATSGAAFLTLTGTASGSGAGTWQVPYSYTANPSTTSTRQGSISFNGAFPGGATFTLTQQPSSSSGNLPNLTPYKPAAWADKVVVSKVAGTDTDDALSGADTLYVDWAVLNNGAAAAPAGFFIDILIDGNLAAYWYADTSLDPNYYLYSVDWSHVPLSIGTHTVTLIADSTNAVTESNENDNTYTKTIQIGNGAGRTRGDFNGDGRADIGVFRPSNGMWYSAVFYPTQWGQNGDIPVPGDYNGDGREEIAVFRPSNGTWYSSVFYPTVWGQSGDIPVPADYDGDGDDDIAVFRPSTGMWYSAVFYPTQWGQNGDVPVPADYDGDGRAEIAVFRPSTGTWYSSKFYPTVWGQSGDIPVPADYDGDGDADIAVFRPSNGMWYSSIFYPTQWGQNGDIPVPADYDGDGDDDIAVFRPSTKTWYSAVFYPTVWGEAGDFALTSPIGSRKY